jgi:hypothetical protein
MSNFIKVTDEGIIFAELSASENPGGWTQVEDGRSGLAGRTYNVETKVIGPELPPVKSDFEGDLSRSLNEYLAWSNTLKVSIANSAPESSITQLNSKVDSLWDYYLTVLAKWDAADS